jgi:hypothetical protein
MNQHTYIEILESVISDLNNDILPKSLQIFKNTDPSVYIQILEDNILEQDITLTNLQKQYKLTIDRAVEVINVIFVINEHRKTV